MTPKQTLIVEKLIENSWQDELKSYEENNMVEIPYNATLEEMLAIIEENGTDHIFYWLVLAKIELRDTYQSEEYLAISRGN
jgi:hypothetical protein